MAIKTARRDSEENMSPLERIRQLEAEKARIMQDARREALEKAQSVIDELNSLGFNYRLVEGGAEGRRRASGVEGSRKGTRQVNPERPCPICGFRTDPPHDARAHRSQGDSKRAFTADELSARGLSRA